MVHVLSYVLKKDREHEPEIQQDCVYGSARELKAAIKKLKAAGWKRSSHKYGTSGPCTYCSYTTKVFTVGLGWLQ